GNMSGRARRPRTCAEQPGWAAPASVKISVFPINTLCELTGITMNAPQTMTDRLLAEKKDGIGWITFNNPARHNAVSFEMWQALPVILNDFVADPEVRVIILKGAGEKAFVAGADISQFKEKRSSEDAVAAYNAAADLAGKTLQECAKPT